MIKECKTSITSVDARRIWVVASTGDTDRDQDRIDPQGWDTTEYQKNPCVMFGHDYRSLPVAKCIELKTTRRGLEALIEFPERGVHPFADTVHDMMRSGFLSAVSVGFRPLEGGPAKDRKQGNDWSRCVLHEISIVPVPSNPHCLVQREYAHYAKTLTAWAKQAQRAFPHKEDTMTRGNDPIVIRIVDPPQKVAYGSVNDPLWAMQMAELKKREDYSRRLEYWRDFFGVTR